MDRLLEAMSACHDQRAPAVAMRILATYTPEGVGAFYFDPAQIANRCSTDREPLSADAIEAMRGDLARFFAEVSGGRWAPNPDIFVANDPYTEVAA